MIRDNHSLALMITQYLNNLLHDWDLLIMSIFKLMWRTLSTLYSSATEILYPHLSLGPRRYPNYQCTTPPLPDAELPAWCDVHIIGILAVLYEGTVVATEQSRLHKSLSTFAPHLCLFITALSLKTVFVTLAPAPHAWPWSGQAARS